MLITVLPRAAFGLATEHFEAPTQHDWADGLVALPRHDSRVYSLWVNGGEAFYFNTSIDGITDLITLYSKSHLRDHVVELKKGHPTAKSLRDKRIAYNVALTVSAGLVLSHRRRDPQ